MWREQPQLKRRCSRQSRDTRRYRMEKYNIRIRQARRLHLRFYPCCGFFSSLFATEAMISSWRSLSVLCR